MHPLETDPRCHVSEEQRNEPHQPATLVAVQALLLWPHGTPTTDSTHWPVLALVLDESAVASVDGVRQLFELLDRPTVGSGVSVVSSRCRWTVLDGKSTLRKLSITADAPVNFEVNILLPSRPLLDMPAHGGATLALTLRQRAIRIADGMAFQDALRELVLLTHTLPEDLITGRRPTTDT